MPRSPTGPYELRKCGTSGVPGATCNATAVTNGQFIANVPVEVYNNPALLHDAYTEPPNLSALRLNYGFADYHPSVPYDYDWFFQVHLGFKHYYEKWIKMGASHYAIILPNGQLRTWDDSPYSDQDPSCGNLISILPTSVYADPTLLLNAQ